MRRNIKITARVTLRHIAARLTSWPDDTRNAKMLMIYQLLQLVLGVVYWIMIIHIIMSWLISFQVLNTHQPLVAQIWTGLNKLLEPIYRPIRRYMPDTHPLDLAPLVAFVIVIALRAIILPGIFL